MLFRSRPTGYARSAQACTSTATSAHLDDNKSVPRRRQARTSRTTRGRLPLYLFYSYSGVICIYSCAYTPFTYNVLNDRLSAVSALAPKETRIRRENVDVFSRDCAIFGFSASGDGFF